LELIYVINGASQSALVGWHTDCTNMYSAVAYPGILFGGWGVQQILLRIEDREKGDLGAAAPQSGVLEAAVIW